MRPLGYGWVTTGTEIRLLRRQESEGLAAGTVLVPECRNRPKAGGRSVWYPGVHATGHWQPGGSAGVTPAATVTVAVTGPSGCY